jgi:hypothetical protein
MPKCQPPEHKEETDKYDIRWVRCGPNWGLEPRWVTEPNMAAVLKAVKDAIDLERPGTVKLHVDGASSKLYAVESRDRKVLARVNLPIEPRLKTLSEVATLQWVRDNTRLPVPRVLAYNAARTYPVGYEWIIMEKLPGRTLADAWHDMSNGSKEKLVRQIATFFSDSFSHQRRGIGNLMPAETDWVVLESPLETLVRENGDQERPTSPETSMVTR